MSTAYPPTTNGRCAQVLAGSEGPTTENSDVACPTTSSPLSSSAASTSSSSQTPSSIVSTSTQAQSDTPSASAAISAAPNPVQSLENTLRVSSTVVPGQHGNGTTAAPIPTPSAGSKGLAGGAVAGIAIGMLLAGALIVGVIFFFLLRRQKRRQAMSTAAYSRQHAPYTERNAGPEKGATVVAAPVGSIDDLLPQPAEDNAITGDLSKIRDNIKNHVRTYYHSDPISAADINEASVHDIAALTGASAAVLAKVLEDPLTRDNALRSLVGSVILTRCTGERSPSLLPKDVATLSASIPPSTGFNSQSALYSKWKVVTGALLQQRYSKDSQDPGRAQAFQDTIASLDSILAPFVKSSNDGGQRRKNLDMILTRAAKFAFLLFSQPGTFRFDFTSRRSSLTVFPALVQTVGDQGQPLSPIKVLTEKEVMAA